MQKLLTYFFCLFTLTASAQTLINQRVLDTLSGPSHVYGYFKGLPDASGNYLAISNTYVSSGQREDYNLYKISPRVLFWLHFLIIVCTMAATSAPICA